MMGDDEIPKIPEVFDEVCNKHHMEFIGFAMEATQ